MKKKLQKCLLLAATILFSSIAANAQWSSIASVYGGAFANDGAESFSIGNKGYVVSGSATSTMYVYDTLANSWSLVCNIPANMGHSFGMSFVVNGKGYIVGGDTSATPQNTVWEFDPLNTINPWTQKNNFPGGARDAGFGFAINNFGYVGAGFDGSNLYNDIWKYNPDSDSWTALTASLPINGLIFPASFVVGSKGYILTGGTFPNTVNEITNTWCFDATNDSVSVKANFAGIARQAAFAFSNNYYGFVGGGQSNYTNNYYDMWMYDVANNQWLPAPNAPLFGANWSSTFVIGNTAYAGLGSKFVGAGLQGIDSFFRFRMSSSSTGINETSKNNVQFIIYPNPASDNLHLMGAVTSSAKISISDMMGRTIREEESFPDNRTISIGDLSPGVYTIQIREKNQISNSTFIKN